MTIYVVVAKAGSEKLDAKVKSTYPDENHAFSGSSWFVYDTGTTKQVSEKLGIADGTLGTQAIVMPITGWSGFAPSDTWEWLKPRWEKDQSRA